MRRISFRARSRRKAILFALAITVFVLFFCEIALADKISLPDDHAPIGIMGDHNHEAGEWMASLSGPGWPAA